MAVLSIRERALRALVALFESQEAGVPAPWSIDASPYDFTWSTVVRYPMSDLERRKNYSLSIVEVQEVKERGVNWMDPTLSLELTFFVMLDTEESGPEVLNQVLLNIQRRIRCDPRLANQNSGTALVIDLYETGNSVDMEYYADKKLYGTVDIAMRYKHSVNDPREVAGPQI